MPKHLSLTTALYRYSVYFFAAILLISFVSFWRFYYSKIFAVDMHHHVHAAIMTLWVVLLVAEASLIRLNYRTLHKLIGRLSYLLAPAVVVSIVVMRHYQATKNSPDFSDFQLFFIALNLLSNAPLFALAYGLAMYYRRNVAVHARFMFCTVFPAIIGPIMTRIFRFFIYPRTEMLPWFDGMPMPMDVIDPLLWAMLACLAYWDWKVHRQHFVFPLMLGLSIATRLLVNAIYDTAIWRSFVEWFMSLPIS